MYKCTLNQRYHAASIPDEKCNKANHLDQCHRLCIKNVCPGTNITFRVGIIYSSFTGIKWISSNLKIFYHNQFSITEYSFVHERRAFFL